MNKIIYTSALFFISTIAFGQVSVNNNDITKGVFYVNPTGSTSENGGLIVTEEGNMGIGTSAPTEKLDVVGNMTISLTDTIKGNLNATNNIVVGENSNLRLSGGAKDDLSNLEYNLEIKAIEPKGAFRFDDGSQKIASTSSSIIVPVLSRNATTGTVTWTDLPSITEVKTCNIINGINVAGSETSPVDITESKGLTLTEGLWLILASTPTDNGGSAAASRSTKGLYVYMILTEDKDPSTEIARVGAATEYSKNGAGYGVATPQLTYPLVVPAGGGTYRVKLATSIGQTGNGSSTIYNTNTIYGSSYFYAIKLDYKN